MLGAENVEQLLLLLRIISVFCEYTQFSLWLPYLACQCQLYISRQLAETLSLAQYKMQMLSVQKCVYHPGWNSSSCMGATKALSCPSKPQTKVLHSASNGGCVLVGSLCAGMNFTSMNSKGRNGHTNSNNCCLWYKWVHGTTHEQNWLTPSPLNAVVLWKLTLKICQFWTCH